ncbi:MAG: hypothetical protein ACR2QC_04275 [Gammaproteobacteria bacterium]
MGAPGGGKGSIKGTQQDVNEVDIDQLIRRQANQNRIDQVTPFGSLTFSTSNPPQTVTRTFRVDPRSGTRVTGRQAAELGPNFGVPQSIQAVIPGSGRPIATTELSEDQQRILDLQEGLLQALGGQALDLATRGELFSPFNVEENRTDVEDAVFGRGLRLLQPVFDRQEDALTQRLANQGLPVGSEAFNEDFRSFNTGRDQVLADLADRALIASGAEQTRLLGARAQPLNEILAVLGQTQVQQPTFFGPGQVDVLGAQSLLQSAQAANQAASLEREAQQQELIGSLGSAGILAAALCWVARAVYGENNPEWLVYRTRMLTKAPVWFITLYIRYGPWLARQIKRYPVLRRILKPIMDRLW